MLLFLVAAGSGEFFGMKFGTFVHYDVHLARCHGSLKGRVGDPLLKIFLASSTASAVLMSLLLSACCCMHDNVFKMLDMSLFWHVDIHRCWMLNRQCLLLYQDPEASYDVNDDDSDPQPRYEYTNENRSAHYLLLLLFSIIVGLSVECCVKQVVYSVVDF